MRVTRLKIVNLRAIEVAEFHFQSGFNLIVGVNGVGKTSVLDALVVCLSAIVKQANRLRMIADSFSIEDIRNGAEMLTIETCIQIAESEYNYIVHKPRMSTKYQTIEKNGYPRVEKYRTPQQTKFIGEIPTLVTGKESIGRPFAVLFSTRRAVPSDRLPTKSKAAGGIQSAYAEAFKNRELRLAEFAEWMRVQQTLETEKPSAGRVFKTLNAVVSRFLPEYKNLRVEGKVRPDLLIDHGKMAIKVRQLSDGERGILAMVLDLTRRLSRANPNLIDPAAEAEAVVLIDEIDLHLHPKWQRQIIQNLTAAFPKCQFIATTHSPQVIGEVDHDRIQIMSDGQVYSPTHSFGVDSSRVLEEIMDTNSRTREVQKLLTKFSLAIRKDDLKNARKLLNKLIEQLGKNDPEVTRASTLIDFIAG
jgi:predicted ATP-binding protein involved in virulence